MTSIFNSSKTNSVLITIFHFIFFFSCLNIGLSQEKLEIEGALILSDNDSPIPAEGSIRYNSDTKDFEGWNGLFWASLTRSQTGIVSDIDGNDYLTVKIGAQEWMAENLRVSQLNDASVIFNFQDPVQWLNLWENPAWCNYNNNSMNDELYGKLYNGVAVKSGKLCPVGWRVPTTSEFTVLISILGNFSNAGGFSKTIGTLDQGSGLWSSPNTDATNVSGFSGVPAGYRNESGDFVQLSFESRIWTTICTQLAGIPNTCSTYSLNHDSGEFVSTTLKDDWGGSVRCIKE